LTTVSICLALPTGEAAGGIVMPVDGPNPTSGRFAVAAPLIPGASALLTVFDLAGRRIAVVRGRPGSQLVWEGKDAAGMRMGPGIYLYRLAVGKWRQEGKIVVVR